MLTIIEVAEFNWLNCPIDRNRELIAEHLSSSEFRIVALSEKEKSKNTITTIPTSPRKLHKLKSYLKLAFTKGDILHTRAWPECILIYLLWKIRNPKGKHVLTIHGLPIVQPSYTAGMVLSKLADKITVVSKITQNEVKEAYNVDSVVIYNGIDSKKFKPIMHENKRLKILYVGRLEPHKNPDYLLKYAQKFPECDFLLYGKGSMENQLVQESTDIDNVYIKGAVPFSKIQEIYSSADIFLFPTVSEGFANVMLEAASSGLPIVCFNATSMPEFIEHGKNGYLADNDEEMEEYLSILIKSDDKRHLFAQSIRKKAEDFDWKKIADQYKEMYLELIDK